MIPLATVLLKGALPSVAFSPSAPPQKPITALLAVTQKGQLIDLATVKEWKVIYFWSSACPCVKRCQERSLVPLAARYKNRVRFFAVASNAANVRYGAPPSSDARETLNQKGQGQSSPSLGSLTGGSTASMAAPPSTTPTLELWGDEPPRLPYLLVLDDHHRLANALGAAHTPETFLVSPDNRIVFRGDPDDSGAIKTATHAKPGSRHYLAEALAQVLTGKKIKEPVAPTYGCEIDLSDVVSVPSPANQ